MLTFLVSELRKLLWQLRHYTDGLVLSCRPVLHLNTQLPVQEQMGQDDNTTEQQGTGIVLRRKKREANSPSKVGDALAIAEMVQRLCQVLDKLLYEKTWLSKAAKIHA